MDVLKAIHSSKVCTDSDFAQVEFRFLTRENVGDVIRLEPQIFPRGWSKALIESEFENPHSVKVGIFLADHLVGYSFSRVVEDEFNLLNIGVELKHRGIGLGQKLLESLLREASERGCSIAFLEVRESNILAQSIYQKAGFRFTGKRPFYYSDNNESALLMELSFFL